MKQKSIICIIITLLCGHLLVIKAQSSLTLQCGDILEGEFLPSQSDNPNTDTYTLDVQAGTKIDFAMEPLGQNFNVGFVIRDSAGTDIAFYNFKKAGNIEEVINYSVGGSNLIIGVYGMVPTVSSNDLFNYADFYLGNRGAAGYYLGAYQISLGCTLRDGTVIAPGENLLPDPTPNPKQSSPQQPIFTGFGFPGITPIDFSSGIEIPIQAGQPQVAPVGGDLVSLYTYDASANSTATLSLSRVSGDISIGVTVIKRDSNEILFIGGMPSSNNLSVELTFPSDGTYVIGLFRMDTAEKSDTSGAVQVSIE